MTPDVYDILLEEPGGPFSSTSSSIAPRNVKQIQNRKHASNISRLRETMTEMMSFLSLSQHSRILKV